MTELMEIEPQKLFIHVMIIALATVGCVEWWKTLVKGDNPNKRISTRTMLVVSTMFLVVSAVVQISGLTWLVTCYNLITLGNACVKFAHKALIKIPEMAINKAFGIKNEGESTNRERRSD